MTLIDINDATEVPSAWFDEVKDRLGPIASKTTTSNGEYWTLNASHIVVGSGGSAPAALIQEAIDALGSTGGVVDARAIRGAVTFATTIDVKQNVTLLLGPADITASTQPAIRMGLESALIGMNPHTTKITTNGTGTIIRGISQADSAQTNVRLENFLISNTVNTHVGSRGIDMQGIANAKLANISILDVETGVWCNGNQFYNNYYAVDVVRADVGFRIKNGHHEQTFYQCRTLACRNGAELSFCDNQRFIGPVFETMTGSGFVIGNDGLTTTNNLLLNPRFESAEAGAIGITLGANSDGTCIIMPKFQSLATDISGTGNSTVLLRGGSLTTNYDGNPALNVVTEVGSANIDTRANGQSANNRRIRYLNQIDFAVQLLDDAGVLQFSPVQGFRDNGRAILGDGSWGILGTQNTVIPDAQVPVEGTSFWIDEAANALKVKVKYADGTVKNGTVATLT